MVYGNFKWRHNPERCAWSCERDIIKHKYPELTAIELEDLNSTGAIIYGTGEFFGPHAYYDFQALQREFNSGGIKQFFHPIFQDVKFAKMKKFEATLEPIEDYVSYSFEFWQHIPVVSESKLVVKKTSAYLSNANASSLQVGSKGKDVITLQTKLVSLGFKLPKYGIDGIYGNETATAVKQFQKANKLQITGKADAETLAKLGIALTAPATSDTVKVHTVKKGETLSGICLSYGIKDWKSVAKYNNLKNPNLITIGQKIKIKV